MWKTEKNTLTQEFKFKDFKQAFSFMTQVAFEAEKMDHHPEWTNIYNKVTVKLSTHDAGNIVTDKDHALAKKIDKIFEGYKS